MRLFFAINFSEETRARLLKLRDEIQARSRYGRFCRSENLHLTLAFLGECNAEQLAAAKSALDAVSFEPFTVSINRAGRFSRGGGALWWAGIRDNAALSKLQGELSARLREAGFTIESRAFSPHITIGREVSGDFEQGKFEPFEDTVASVELMKSENIRGTLTYTAIYTKQAGRRS